MAMYGHVSPPQTGIAVVLTSIASALAELALVQRQPKLRPQMRALVLSSAFQMVSGGAIFVAIFHWAWSR